MGLLEEKEAGVMELMGVLEKGLLCQVERGGVKEEPSDGLPELSNHETLLPLREE